MKKFNHKIKRAVAMFLTFAMVVGLIPYVPTRAHEVQAATTSSTGGTPSVSAYATKEQMMDGTFATNTEGKADNYGKILFGKAELFNNTSDTHPIEWLILGKDEGVAGDNTIILATRMINFVQYNTTQNMYINIAGDITENDARYPLKNTYVYPGCTLPNEIDCSHYGLSLLRAQAILAANDSNLFSMAQQELMNATTVTTTDTRNKDSAGKNLTYTTTDKLYAPATDKIGCTYIKVGSNNQVVIDIESFKKYYDSTFQYWTRTAYDGNSVYIFPEVSLTKTHVTLCSDIKNFLPVSNLNLSNLLFASSAKAATSNTESGAVSGTIAADTALTLRLDGKDKKIGAAYCDAEDGVIVADKAAAATGTVSLVVQGNDGTNDWYYSVPVEGRTVVKADEIKSKCSLSTAPNLADCHIWLEITDTDGMVYANSAKAKDISLIDNVAVTGVKPVGGMAFTTASCTTTGIAITTAKITYTTKENENDVAVTDKLAAWDKTYKATFSLATGIENDVVYAFTDHVSVNIDGEGTDNTISPNADGTLTVTKEFTTLKRKIVSVTAPAVPADNTFTTYYGFDGNADSP